MWFATSAPWTATLCFVELNLTGERQNRPYDPVDFKRLYSNYHDHRDVLMPFEANVYLAEGEAKA